MGLRKQGVFWLLTVPANAWEPPTSLPENIAWLKGQKERGSETAYEHWQLVVAFKKKSTLAQCKKAFGATAHCELSRSEAANDYVWKDDTAVVGTRFELGAKPIRVNSKTDWDSVWVAAQTGKLMAIPANIRVVSYRTLRGIAADYDTPLAVVRSVRVFWGPTGTGKSRLAWTEAGVDAYPKSPRSIFWCGYQGQDHVVIDEFRGGIDIAHLLIWLDRYPVRIETKGSSRPLSARKIWITSNLDPEQWYPDVDYHTRDALMRRLEVFHMDGTVVPAAPPNSPVPDSPPTCVANDTVFS